jgi:hypothetical protein
MEVEVIYHHGIYAKVEYSKSVDKMVTSIKYCIYKL